MPKVLKLENAEKVKTEIQNYFSANKDARFVRRLDVIALICNGHALNCLASLFLLNPTTVQRWVHRLNESRFQSLRDNQGRGRCPELKYHDRLKLKEDLIKNPKDFGYNRARWDGKLLSHH